MLDPGYVRAQREDVLRRLQSRGGDFTADLQAFEAAETRRRDGLQRLEALNRDQKGASDEVARARKEGRDTAALVQANKQRGAEIKGIEAEQTVIEEERDVALLRLPNLPHESVPVGRSAGDNVEIKRWGTPPAFDFTPKPHWDLGTALGILDFERAARMSGARFTVFLGQGARLARA